MPIEWGAQEPQVPPASVSSDHAILFEIIDAFNFAFFQGPWDRRPSGMSDYRLHPITLLITVLSGVK